MDDTEDSQSFDGRAMTPPEEQVQRPTTRPPGCPCEAVSGVFDYHLDKYHHSSPSLSPLDPQHPATCTPIEPTVLSPLHVAVEGCSGRNATFTCGGRIPFDLSAYKDRSDLPPETQRRKEQQKVLTKPVAIRYEDHGHSRKLAFPPIQDIDDGSAVVGLIKACVPASFGRSGQNVFDESYRRASALSVNDFMTDFCPYEVGIIDIVNQLLLPPVSADLEPRVEVNNSPKNPTRDQIARIHIEIAKVANRFDMVLMEDAVNCLVELGVRLTKRDAISILHHGDDDLRNADLMPAKDLFACIVDHLRHPFLQTPPGGDAFRTQISKWRGIRAELYKLNVYSGPSGKFKAHVDTPRSETQIGSLVVCLPVAFEGGALAVRHQGREIVHDWSAGQGGDPELEAKPPCLQWAAFYSDCEHEVMPVTSGSRITLTYNLYLSAGTGLLAGHLRGLQPATLPVLTELKRTLQKDTFMQDGGYLGYFLVHSYPHSNGTLLRLVPNMLKGADLAMYEALRATNLTCVLEPISDSHGKYLSLLDSLEGKERQNNSEPGTPPSGLTSVDVNNAMVEEVDEEEVCDSQMEEAFGEYVLPDYDRITWLNSHYGKNRELNPARLVYGNEAELKVRYSHVALIAKVPKYSIGRGL
ncbi:hypothetical protein Tdes44962_MAKER06250 [Teratosphaeria destructans]|uniref:Fe2OG dioxygenase domain-containing protein n=1 Tax=Teratosphaeria destructans TaxID=418781 RepID=A0A9W7SHW7_9PEZI|nr:hypothetical protein Tdes44962_MAKER06250 [Teratosphaeria destructans]